MKLFPSISLLITTLCLTEVNANASNCMSLEDAAKKGLIKLTIKGKGGHVGDVIEMKLKNLTNRILDLNIEAGRVLDSEKPSEQDILVTHTENVSLAANQEKKMSLNGMCCQAHNASPQAGSNYKLSKMADTTLTKLANFIDEQKLYNSYTAQQAVWTISDGYSLGSINGNEEEENLLRKFVAKITGRKIPTYNISYLREDNRSVSGHASTIEGVFNYTIPVNGKITVGIYNSNGELVQLIFKDQSHQKGDCKVYYTFNTRNLDPGVYHAKMLMNGAVQREQAIEF